MTGHLGSEQSSSKTGAKQKEVSWARKQMEKALAQHQKGNLQGAEDYYRQVLRLEPNEPDANNLLGVLLFQTKRAADGLQYLGKATQLNGEQAMFFYNYAVALRAVGKADEAIQAFSKCLELDSGHFDSLKALADLCLKRKKHGLALKTLQKLIAVRPEDAYAYKRVGELLQASKKHEEAIKAFRKACELAPQEATHWHQLGLCQQALKKSDEAIASYRKSIELKPELGAAHNNLAILLADRDELSDAVDHYRQAIEHNPKLFQTRCNLGGLLRRMGRLQDSIDCLEEAVELKKDCAEAWCNLGNSLGDLGEIDRAKECYQTSLLCKPDYAQARLNRSLAMLRMEDFENGWIEYEWRSKLKECPRRHANKTRWSGLVESGKRILLHVEQGLGDTFQMIRYAQWLGAQGMHVVLEAQKPLKEFLDFNGVAPEIFRMGEKLPDVDYQLPLMSLPGVLWQRLGFHSDPYLTACTDRRAKWKERLRQVPGKKKFGIAWQGNPAFKQDAFRSIPLDAMRPIIEDANTHFVSIQKMHGLEQLESFSLGEKIHTYEDLDSEGGAFMDTAALMLELDGIVTSDSAVAHLAGALGVEVHLILPFAADWRWLHVRSDCPWYPSMSIYRQTKRGDWSTPVTAAAQAMSR